MELLERPVTDLLLRLPPRPCGRRCLPVVVIDDPSIAAVGALAGGGQVVGELVHAARAAGLRRWCST
jgi:hypothetical protein